MYSTSHFHSTSHEVLGIANGKARLCFGHEDNPKRVEEVLTKGDVIVVPAGVAHRLLEDLEGGFEMVCLCGMPSLGSRQQLELIVDRVQVGCYPTGFNWDMCYGKKGEESKIEKIKDLAWFQRDPVYGDEGPALDV